MSKLSLTFADVVDKNKDGITFLIDPCISSKTQIMDYFASSLRMPEFFGNNWDALLDMLRDLSWIDDKYITIIHTDIPKLEADNLKAYLHVLNDAVLSWGDDDNHHLSVVFPCSTQSQIEKYFD